MGNQPGDAQQGSARPESARPESARPELDRPGIARFGKHRRLLNASDYSRVFDGAEAKASHRHLLLLARTNDGPGHRLGLVIAKKNVRLAVQRNRVKRIAREVFRTLPQSEPSMDVVLLARRGLDQLDKQQLATIFRQQWNKLARQVPTTGPSSHRDN